MIINVRGNMARALDSMSERKAVLKDQLHGLLQRKVPLDLGDTGFQESVRSEAVSADGRTRIYTYAPEGVDVPLPPQHEVYAAANHEELASIQNQVTEQAVAAGHPLERVQDAMAPAQEHHALVPVRLENGHLAYARVARVTYAERAEQASQGGFRFLGSNTIDQTRALALGQQNKNAGANLNIKGDPILGAKGAVSTLFDPEAAPGEQFIAAEALSTLEKQRVASNFLRTIGIDYAWDGFAPDMNSDSAVMRALDQTYQQMLAERGLPPRPSPVTCKPVERSRFLGRLLAQGGSPVRDRATGLGVLHSAMAMAKEEGLNPRGAVTVVQGSGNVGLWYARLATQAGMKLGAISEKEGAVRFDPPLDALGVRKLTRHMQQGGRVAEFKHASAHPISNDELWSVPADVLVPAAGPSALTESTMRRILSPEAAPPSGKRKLIPEGGNEAANAEGEELLEANQDRLVSMPGLAANHGGVFASGNIERAQNLSGKTISLREGKRMIKQLMQEQYGRIVDRSARDGISVRNAAYREASDRVMARDEQTRAVSADPVVPGENRPHA